MKYKNELGKNLIDVILMITILILIVIMYNIFLSSQDDKEIVENINIDNVVNLTSKNSKRYYYNQLDENEKKLYITILNNIDKIKNNEEIKIKSINEENKVQMFQNVWDAIMLDNSELFYIDVENINLTTIKHYNLFYEKYEYKLSSRKENKYIYNKWKNRVELDKAIEEVEKISNNIVKEANRYKSNYEKIKYIHDYLVETVEYKKDDVDLNRSVYGTLIERKAICEGYAKTFKYLVDKLNLECVTIYGEAINSENQKENHAWNYIKLEDGEWYAVDVTWDDPIIIGEGNVPKEIKYKYFLIGEEKISKDHKIIENISENGKKFKYPILSLKGVKDKY